MNPQIDLSGHGGEPAEFWKHRALNLADAAELAPPHKVGAYRAIARDAAPVVRALTAIKSRELMPEERARRVQTHPLVLSAKRAGRLATVPPPIPGLIMPSDDGRLLDVGPREAPVLPPFMAHEIMACRNSSSLTHAAHGS